MNTSSFSTPQMMFNMVPEVNKEESKDPAWFDKVYPFKADEFGQLALPENVIKAKLVSLNNYGA